MRRGRQRHDRKHDGYEDESDGEPVHDGEKSNAKNVRKMTDRENAIGNVPTSVVPPPFRMLLPIVRIVYCTRSTRHSPGVARNAWQKCSV